MENALNDDGKWFWNNLPKIKKKHHGFTSQKKLWKKFPKSERAKQKWEKIQNLVKDWKATTYEQARKNAKTALSENGLLTRAYKYFFPEKI